MRYPFLSLAFDESHALSTSKFACQRHFQHSIAVKGKEETANAYDDDEFRTVLSFEDRQEWVLGASAYIGLKYGQGGEGVQKPKNFADVI